MRPGRNNAGTAMVRHEILPWRAGPRQQEQHGSDPRRFASHGTSRRITSRRRANISGGCFYITAGFTIRNMAREYGRRPKTSLDRGLKMQVTLDKPLTVHGPALITMLYSNTDVVMVGKHAMLPHDKSHFVRESVVVDGPGQRIAILNIPPDHLIDEVR